MAEVKDNPDQQRFELAEDGAVAFVAYARKGEGPLVLTHTEVPAALEGRGIGTRLVGGTLDLLRARGERVVPQCPFVAAFIGRHPEYKDVVAAPG